MKSPDINFFEEGSIFTVPLRGAFSIHIPTYLSKASKYANTLRSEEA